MAKSNTRKQFNQFLVAVLFVALLAALLKIGLTLLCEVYVYSIPILGGLLQSLEVVEFTNFLAFAILGFGVGAATVMLPGRARLRLGAIALAILTPIILSLGYVTRHHLWVRAVAAQGQMEVAQARAISDTFLEVKAGHGGSLGFYLYTVQIPIAPLSAREMQEVDSTQARFQADLTDASGLESSLVKLLFNIVGWGLRAFYIFIAVMTMATYFYKGMGQAQVVRRQRMSVQT